MEEALEKKKIFWHKFHVVTNFIMIFFLVVTIIYVPIKVMPEIDSFKTLNKDVCAYCMFKTNSSCIPNAQVQNALECRAAINRNTQGFINFSDILIAP